MKTETEGMFGEIDGFYNQNKTMRMIGNSALYTYVVPGGEAHEDFENILCAYIMKKRNVYFKEMLSAFFALGFIWGQRKERQRRKRETINNMDAIQYYHYCKDHAAAGLYRKADGRIR